MEAFRRLVRWSESRRTTIHILFVAGSGIALAIFRLADWIGRGGDVLTLATVLWTVVKFLGPCVILIPVVILLVCAHWSEIVRWWSGLWSPSAIAVTPDEPKGKSDLHEQRKQIRQMLATNLLQGQYFLQTLLNEQSPIPLEGIKQWKTQLLCELGEIEFQYTVRVVSPIGLEPPRTEIKDEERWGVFVRTWVIVYRLQEFIGEFQ